MATTPKNWHARHRAQLTFGQRIADMVAATMGSWSFIIIQSVILAVWIVLNVMAWISHWDPYPFILLNLALSFQASPPSNTSLTVAFFGLPRGGILSPRVL